MVKKVLKVAVAVLIPALLAFLLFSNRLPFGRENSSFATDPGKEITRIEFSTSGNKLVLEKKDEDWVINGSAVARKSGIMFITRVLREIKIKSPVSDELFRTEIAGNAAEPERVKVYDGRKLLNSFIVYKTSSNPYGNIMKKSERSRPFIVHVPGYDGEIGSAFTMNELFWQPYTVFSSLPSEISSVEVVNYSDSTASFSISQSNHQFRLMGGGHELTGWDSSLVNRYFSYYAFIPFERWALELGEDERRKYELQQPAFRITLSSVTGEKTILTLWDIVKGEGSDATRDSDRLMGRLSGGKEFFVLRYFDIDPILKKRSYFFAE